MCIGPRQVEFNFAIRSNILENRREVAGVKTGCSMRDQGRKRTRPHQSVHLRHIVDAKKVWPIHVSHRNTEVGAR